MLGPETNICHARPMVRPLERSGVSALSLVAALHLAASCAPTVAPETLLSVAGTESGYTQAGRAFTHPFAIGINGPGGGARFYESAREATSAAAALIASGVTNIDLGIAQINWRAGHLQRRGLSLSAAFDPCTSLRVGGEVLAECWARSSGPTEQARLRAAIGCYNAGHPVSGTAYVLRVEASASRVVPAIRLADSSSPDAAAPEPRGREAAPRGGQNPDGDEDEMQDLLHGLHDVLRAPPQAPNGSPAPGVSTSGQKGAP